MSKFIATVGSKFALQVSTAATGSEYLIQTGLGQADKGTSHLVVAKTAKGTEFSLVVDNSNVWKSHQTEATKASFEKLHEVLAAKPGVAIQLEVVSVSDPFQTPKAKKGSAVSLGEFDI